MARLGISLYPEHSTPERDKAYIEMAAKYGVSRVFTCLISMPDGKTPEEIKADFQDMIEHAHAHHMEVTVDVAPAVFEKLGISYQDLSFFSEMGADGIRLDESYDSLQEALLTYNPQNLQIEINASFGNGYIANIMSHHPRHGGLTTCFNFYPQRYSGLSFSHFEHCAKDIRACNLPIAAFISSQADDTFGPWPVREGLCTLEMHRNLPIDVQARHLYATGLVDDVMIGNAYATQTELEQLAKTRPGVAALKIDHEYAPSPIEREIIYQHPHFVRGDVSEYMLRSTMPRVTHAAASIAPNNTRDLHYGDVVVLNDAYGRYKGELHIVLKDMPNEGNKNVVGHIPPNEHIIIPYLYPWRSFSFIEQ